MDFSQKLQLIRKQNGLSQEELAEKVGVSRQAVAKWESGQASPDIGNLLRLSSLLSVSIDRLLKTDDDDCVFKLGKERFRADLNLAEFLCRAKKETYAGKGGEIASSRPASHDLQYSEGAYSYYDTYLGGEKFAGAEAVWLEQIPVWGMNYVGRVTDEGFSGDFLKEALFHVPIEYPFRGPMLYLSGDFAYHCTVSGGMEWYQGYEDIFLGTQKVYECFFHGGSIE